ncbi:hypothetical protein ACFOPX_05460 [Helicobacter baculiformis]|uniref:Uncharacterized protein n=1 Tax=Helicobacter baculiformis TaxID=427351 RepID=A0ABV7ZIJ2_9HELI|nr:hypothetical protein [Helicobacter baculiformis]
MSLPSLLQNNPNVAQFTPEQVREALKDLSAQINILSSTINQDLSKINVANQQIAQDNAHNLAQLTHEKEDAIKQALAQISEVSKVLGRAFRNAWIHYAVGSAFALDNAQKANQTYTYNGRTYDYINNNFSCTFAAILQSMPGWSGSVSKNCSLPNTPQPPSSLQKFGFMRVICGIAFLISKLYSKRSPISLIRIVRVGLTICGIVLSLLRILGKMQMPFFKP